MDTKKDFKDTLLMPRTDFPMRGNLGQNEPMIQKRWEDSRLYDKVLAKNEDRPLYILHDGPPYANGSIHAGTAFNKVLKDFVVRYRNMSGFKAPYLPGWDTHGLPSKTRFQMTEKSIVKSRCRQISRRCAEEYAMEQIDNQRRQFKASRCSWRVGSSIHHDDQGL